MVQMHCKRCGANEDRINGFCSVECEEYYRLEEEINAPDNVILERGAEIGRLNACIIEVTHLYLQTKDAFNLVTEVLLKQDARIAKLEEKLAELVEVGNKMRDLIEQDYDGYLDETIEWRGVAEEADDVLQEREDERKSE